MSTSLQIILLTGRCFIAAHPSPGEALRMAALATLAGFAMAENSPACRLYLGQMRACFRRAVAARQQRRLSRQKPALPWPLAGVRLASAIQ